MVYTLEKHFQLTHIGQHLQPQHYPHMQNAAIHEIGFHPNQTSHQTVQHLIAIIITFFNITKSPLYF